MKLFVSAALFTSANAFSPSSIQFRRLDVAAKGLHASPMSEDAIAEAMRISKAHGATSPQAKVAWDIVEEINASDNSVAYKGNLKEVPHSLLNTDGMKPLESKSKLAESVKPVPLFKTPASQHEDTKDITASMIKALEDAKKITNDFGIESSEAKLAWEALEEIASNDFSEVMKSGLDPEECLVEQLPACEAMEELSQILKL